MCVGVCVCVCQRLSLRFVLILLLLDCFQQLPSIQQQGDHPCAVSDGPTKRPQHMRISGLISQAYLLRLPVELSTELSNSVFLQ